MADLISTTGAIAKTRQDLEQLLPSGRPLLAAEQLPADTPRVIAGAGLKAVNAYWNFYTVEIENDNTRKAYLRAARQFFDWVDELGLALHQITSIHVATYREQLLKRDGLKKATVKSRLVAVKRLFDHLVQEWQILAHSPAKVKTPKLIRPHVLTPNIPSAHRQKLLASFDTSSLAGLRDRAMVAMLFYSGSRCGAVIAMEVRDFRIHEEPQKFYFGKTKGGKDHLVPAHPMASRYLSEYLDVAGIWDEPGSPLFRSMPGRPGRWPKLSLKPLDESAVRKMIKRRLLDAGLPTHYSPHSFRVAASNAFLDAGRRIEDLQFLLNHADIRTTRTYIVGEGSIKFEEICRINA